MCDFPLFFFSLPDSLFLTSYPPSLILRLCIQTFIPDIGPSVKTRRVYSSQSMSTSLEEIPSSSPRFIYVKSTFEENNQWETEESEWKGKGERKQRKEQRDRKVVKKGREKLPQISCLFFSLFRVSIDRSKWTAHIDVHPTSLFLLLFFCSKSYTTENREKERIDRNTREREREQRITKIESDTHVKTTEWKGKGKMFSHLSQFFALDIWY